MMKIIGYFFFIILISCGQEIEVVVAEKAVPAKKIYTAYSQSTSAYENFNATKAVNKIAAMENEYFQQSIENVSRYYGTVWREMAEFHEDDDSISQYEDYINRLNGVVPDSLHCTLYAYEGLKAGLSESQLAKLEQIHKEVWKTREIAGWSVGYILVHYFDWQAYLVLDPLSDEYDHCLKSFKRDESYPVWKQPNIALEQIFIKGEQDSLIDHLLAQHEFGWGFSDQGYHTWLTRYNVLKECNWSGAPAKMYEQSSYDKSLFVKTDFAQYVDYYSHVIIFPRKKKDSNLRVEKKFFYKRSNM